MTNLVGDISNTRLISRILMMYYVERMNQVEIGRITGLSTIKVNRLIKQARELGMIEIRVNTPYQRIVELERKLEKTGDLHEVVVIPTLSTNSDTIFQNLGQASAKFLIDHLRSGDIICLSGGRAIYETVNAIQTDREYKVQVVPAIGGIQGNHFTDVNFLAAELARKLGGKAHQLYAPAFVDSPTERNVLESLRHVKEVLDLARQSNIALVGVGSLIPNLSSYFKFTSFSKNDIDTISKSENGIGEILAKVFDINGNVCARKFNDRVVGLNLDDLKTIPVTIGVAGSNQKTSSIVGALSGHFINTLITDEATVLEVVDSLNNISIQ
jgi:DNA-binding transcriptional regulator LsrR (DeoR family)